MRTLKNKKILITGGAGFIGRHLAKELLADNAKITICDLKKPNLGGKKFVKSDLKNYLKKNKLAFDYIFHLAGSASVRDSKKNPLYDFEQNLENTLFLLEKLKTRSRQPLLVYASSAAVYGTTKKMPISENDPAMPISPYGISKLAAERYILFYTQEYGIKSLILRFFSVNGPGQKKQVVYELSNKMARGEQLEIDSRQSRDFIYIDDLISAIILATRNCHAKGEIYNIATGEHKTLKGVAQGVADTWVAKRKIKLTKNKEIPYSEKVDISKIQKLGFRPRIGLSQGLENIKKWFDTGANNQ